ncbi:MAG: uracil-DNA glycosylase [Legionellales bacterium]|nr:uracil-DNA glycosylase [Legionellales bacterium]|tara:strand:+ start:20034 stop:20672 length:639 start_codon:yes stop_codon:yes gene_type:complete
MNDEYLTKLGIQQWVPRCQQAEQATAQPVDLTSLEARVAACQQCELHKSRTQTVFGVGNPNADIVFVGEAPGANEDRLGEPFVGRAGQLLTKMLAAIGFERQDVYICNVLKCRPPHNRDPSKAEVAQCTPYLEEQLQLMDAKLVVALGRVAAHYLLGVETPLSRLRGQRLQFGQSQRDLLVTYHPAYLLRNPKDKSKSFSDLELAKKILETA